MLHLLVSFTYLKEFYLCIFFTFFLTQVEGQRTEGVTTAQTEKPSEANDVSDFDLLS